MAMQSSLQNGPDLGGVVTPTASETTPTTAVAGATHLPSRPADARSAHGSLIEPHRLRHPHPGRVGDRVRADGLGNRVGLERHPAVPQSDQPRTDKEDGCPTYRGA